MRHLFRTALVVAALAAISASGCLAPSDGDDDSSIHGPPSFAIVAMPNSTIGATRGWPAQALELHAGENVVFYDVSGDVPEEILLHLRLTANASSALMIIDQPKLSAAGVAFNVTVHEADEEPIDVRFALSLDKPEYHAKLWGFEASIVGT